MSITVGNLLLVFLLLVFLLLVFLLLVSVKFRVNPWQMLMHLLVPHSVSNSSASTGSCFREIPC